MSRLLHAQEEEERKWNATRNTECTVRERRTTAHRRRTQEVGGVEMRCEK